MMSLSRQQVKQIARLKQKKYRIQEGKLLIEGARFVIEALQSNWHLDMVIHTHNFREHGLAKQIDALARQKSVACFAANAADFNKITDTSSTQGVIAIVQQKSYTASAVDELIMQRRFLLLAVEALTDPGNLGTLIRTAAWFGIDAVVTGPDCVAWHNPKSLRSSMGAIFHLPVHEVADFQSFLSRSHAEGAQICCADQQGDQEYDRTEYNPRRILLIGNETDGVSAASLQRADLCVTIPRFGSGESLNAAVAAAIIMAEFSKPRKKAPVYE